MLGELRTSRRSEFPMPIRTASRRADFPDPFSPIKTVNRSSKARLRSSKQRKFRMSSAVNSTAANDRRHRQDERHKARARPISGRPMLRRITHYGVVAAAIRRKLFGMPRTEQVLERILAAMNED